MTPPAQVEVAITTSSQVMDWGSLPPPQPPKITMNGQPLSTPGAVRGPNGWQLVVIDSSEDMTNPASIVSNEYTYLNSNDGLWGDTYQWMYSQLVSQLLSSGNIDQQLVLMASFGLDADMPPTNDAYEAMLGLGAGSQLQHWETSVETGSQGGDYIAHPANYILIGYAAFGYGQGWERFDGPGSNPVTSALTVTLNNPVPPPQQEAPAAG